jgi:hypothetical protein
MQAGQLPAHPVELWNKTVQKTQSVRLKLEFVGAQPDRTLNGRTVAFSLSNNTIKAVAITASIILTS